MPNGSEVKDVEQTTTDILKSNYEPGQEEDAEKARNNFLRIAVEQDMDRVKVGAALLNVFNYAVQVQAKRNEWNHDDFRAFIVAHTAIDNIGKRNIQDKREAMNKEHLEELEASLRHGNLPPNEM